MSDKLKWPQIYVYYIKKQQDATLAVLFISHCKITCFGRFLRPSSGVLKTVVELVRNLMAHAQKPVFVFRLNGRVHLNRRGSQFSRLLAAEVCTSALVMLDTLRPEVVWEYPLHSPVSPSLPLQCATPFRKQYSSHCCTPWDGMIYAVRMSEVGCHCTMS